MDKATAFRKYLGPLEATESLQMKPNW